MTHRIGGSLDIYGPSLCPICGNHRETVFAGRYSLTCRDHPGHPLYRKGKHEAPGMEDTTTRHLVPSTPC